MVTKKTFKKPSTDSSVTVETKKVAHEETACCGMDKGSFCPMGAVKIALLALNTILLLVLVLKPSSKDIEVMKAGGKDNYALMEQIFSLDQFKAQQKLGLEQALSQFNGANAQPQVDLNNVTPTENTQPATTDTAGNR